MKKAILITGIITAIVEGLGGLFEVIFGIMEFTPTTINDVTYAADVPMGVANLLVGIWLLAAVVFAIIDIIKRNADMPKGKGIALGVVSAIFGAVVPGVLTIVDSAMNRQ